MVSCLVTTQVHVKSLPVLECREELLEGLWLLLGCLLLLLPEEKLLLAAADYTCHFSSILVLIVGLPLLDLLLAKICYSY
jgi:hypothetical protein